MAKATEKAKSAPADKAKPEEQAIEKPREPMFSKMGFIILLGSNLLIAVVVVVLVSVLSAGKGEGDGKGKTADAQIDRKAIWMKMSDISVPVVFQGNTVTVRTDLVVSFKGEEGAQQEALTHWTSGQRDLLLRGIVADLLSSYSLDAIKDANFKSRFASDVRTKLNTVIKPDEVAAVQIYSLRWN